MNNTKLMDLINSNLTNVRPDAHIDYTQHGNGYCVCIRVPHHAERYVVTNGTPSTISWTEWSLPAKFMVWGIMTPEAIERRISKFLRRHSHLTA